MAEQTNNLIIYWSVKTVVEFWEKLDTELYVIMNSKDNGSSESGGTHDKFKVWSEIATASIWDGGDNTSKTTVIVLDIDSPSPFTDKQFNNTS